MLAANHPLAKVYKMCADAYAEKKKYCDQNNLDMPKFRITLLSKRQAEEKGVNIPEGIHDGRLNLPTAEGMKQVATVIKKSRSKIILNSIYRYILARILIGHHPVKQAYFSKEVMAELFNSNSMIQISMLHCFPCCFPLVSAHMNWAFH